MRFPVIQFVSRLSNWSFRIKESSSSGKWQDVLCVYNETRKAGAQLNDPSLFCSILKACSNLSPKRGKSMQACLIKQRLEVFTSVGNSILHFYVKWGDLDSARSVFECLESRDSVSWNIMGSGYLHNDCFEEGLCWFKSGRASSFEPNISTLVLLIGGCRDHKAYKEGMKLHSYIIQAGFSAVLSVQNSFLGFYTDIGIYCAEKLFDEMRDRDVISWSVMIRGCLQSEEPLAGMQIFQEMLSETDVKPDGVVSVSVLKACTTLGDMKMGTMVHGLVIMGGMEDDLFVRNSLIHMYTGCKDADSAFKVFMEMPQRNIISWNFMLSAFVADDNHEKALSLLYSMKQEEVEADGVTLVYILQIAKHLVQPLQCKAAHCIMIRRGYEPNDVVISSLIDAYAKCNLVVAACTLFDQLKRRDVVSWSTLISGLVHCGYPDQAVAAFNEMIGEKLEPNEITLINLLYACAVSAELRRSKWAHGIAIRKCLAADVAVGTAIIDMYSKCGEIEASRRAFNQIPGKNVVSWSAMIAACGTNGLAYEALALLEKMKEDGVKPNAVTAISVLSACSHGGLVEEGLSFFTSMVPEYSLAPRLEHYACAVDMLGRAGKLGSAVELIRKMPEGMEAGASAWGSLLSSCKIHGNSSLGRAAAFTILEMEPSNSTGYVLASSLYAGSGLMDDAARVRRLAKERGVKVVAGYSLVQVDDRSCRFVAGDISHPMADEIFMVAEHLHRFMKIDYSKVSNDMEC